MYSNCTFCYADLGTNGLVEAFAVGRHLAFDAASGRFWVVCRACGRWNLSPLEERWEAIEAAERLFARLAVRVSTDNICLARAADQTDLIRVGSAGRPELGAWRYGDMFLRRWKRSLVATVVGGGVGAALATGSWFTLAAALPGGTLLFYAPSWVHLAYERRRIVARLRQPDGSVAYVRRRHVRDTQLVSGPEDEWELHVSHSGGKERLTGMEALQVGAPILARVNANGARKQTVADAVAVLGEARDSASLISRIASRNRVHPPGGWPATQMLCDYSKADRLALEMIATAEVEQRALEGELQYLERAWREADELANIADDLLIPDDVRARASDLKARTFGSGRS